jgi:hypothetical protein
MAVFVVIVVKNIMALTLTRGAHFLPVTDSYGIVDIKIAMNQMIRTSSSLTVAYQSSSFGRKVTLLLSLAFTFAAAVFVALMGSLMEPDFWQPVSLANFAVKLILFYFISYVAMTPLGYIWHFFLSSVDAAVALSAYQITNKHVLGLVSSLKALRLPLPWELLPTDSRSARAKSLAQAVQNILSRRRPQQRSKSKAPILLFQQASLFLAP